METLKSFDRFELYELAAKSMSMEVDDKYMLPPYVAVRAIDNWMYRDRMFLSIHDNNKVFSVKDLHKEFQRRSLPLPIPIIPAPKVLIVKPIEIKPKSDLIIPDSARQSSTDLYSTHPMQAYVVAIDPDLEWKRVRLGSRVYLKMIGTDIFRWEDVDYRFINYSFIIGID